MKNRGVALSVRFRLKHGEFSEIESLMADYTFRRKEKQPLEMPSAGSTFKRPEGFFAGKLIMDAGLRGYSAGGAQVSEKHCGFIINRGGASCEDVLRLIEHIRREVLRLFKIQLEPELRIIPAEGP